MAETSSINGRESLHNPRFCQTWSNAYAAGGKRARTSPSSRESEASKSLPSAELEVRIHLPPARVPGAIPAPANSIASSTASVSVGGSGQLESQPVERQ